MSSVQLFSALASERRLSILEWLKDPVSHFSPQKDGDLIEDGVCSVFIAEKLGVSQPTASRHLEILVRAGLITSNAFASGHSISVMKNEYQGFSTV